MEYTIYRDELTSLWIRFKYKVEAESQKDAIKKINNLEVGYEQEEPLWDTAEIEDYEYLNKNLTPIE